MYQALYRKYRPLRFADVVGQSAVTKTLVGQLVGNKIGHAYLFTGTRGTGKTTCAKILARAVNCEHPVNGDPCNECPSCRGILDGSVTDVFEIDAASNNSVDNVRELREDVVYTPALVKYKVYIIDEVHRMSGPAFDALLKTIEEPPAHVIFILATTELHKVPATILSRCQRFDFRRIDGGEIAERLQYVAQQEGIALSEEAAALLGRMGRGSMRDALSLLERATALQGEVTAAAVGDLLGLCDPARLVEAVEYIANHDIAGVLRFLNDMWRESKDIPRLLSEMAVLLRDIALSDVAPELVAASRSQEELQRLQALQEKMTKAGVLGALETLQKGLRDVAQSNDSRVMTEITLMRMCDPRLDTSGAALITRMERLEKAYAGLVRGAKPVQGGSGPNPPKAARTEPDPPPATPARAEPEPPPVAEPVEMIPPPVTTEEFEAPPAPPEARVEQTHPAPVEEASVQQPEQPAPQAPTEEGAPDERIWQDTLEVLRMSGREDLLATLESIQPPTFADGKVIFALEKDSFSVRLLSGEKFKTALLAALEKADGRPHTILFTAPPAPEQEEDNLAELISRMDEDEVF